MQGPRIGDIGTAFRRFDSLRCAIGLDTTMTEPQFDRLWAPGIVNR
jgi:hypothetical protein